MKKIKFAWHVHHEILAEPLTEPIEDRIAYIRESKPIAEQELRLRLLKPVVGILPAKYAAARAGYNAARAGYNAAWAEYDAARARYDAAGAEYTPEIEALHLQECPNCPWNGETIFSTG